ncbi:SlyX family protein [Alteromonas stellipolaris]|jgi:SlyX protein|uniref:Protein SlyX homolog n=1 Tax=Alteromonas stellipolaris TaxID=233316 RepID=A0AAW7Z0J1_9ALTE|nr:MULTISPECIES: SlyX family protein [Alteromonas]AMJ92409.1 SlyX protein [Alteromonas sp. Mac2]AMJ88556.1 SlyX protein [Alteromonas sp. Mac1]ANB25400.1 SlyX protein [Alteromonas stellipolaris]MBZ2160954.1 SlyX family protein [Alteromonas stellipolaris]MDO6533534.1 SlyX family protein [Alteromonas stellipolaris]
MTDKNSSTDSVAFRAELDSTNNSIEELQTKIAFQEHTIEALNEALSSQQQQLDELTYKLRHVIDKVKSIEPSNMAKDSEETPPPHY